MKRNTNIWLPLSLVAFTTCVAPLDRVGHQLAAQTTPWVTAYYAGWQQEFDSLQAEDIDYGAVTHIAHFAIGPDVGGELEIPNYMTPTFAEDLTTHAHAEGVKVLISVGGAGTGLLFQNATNQQNLGHFVDNLIDFMNNRNYDGIDIDWEDEINTDQYTDLVNELRSSQAFAGRLLTAATGWNGPVVADMFFDLRNQLNQINLMTYSMAGPYAWWPSWFNSAINQGDILPGPDYTISVDSMVARFLRHGVPAEKLAIGIDFYGRKWKGGVKNANPVLDEGIHEPRVYRYFFDCWANDCWGQFTTQVFAGQYNWVTVSPGLTRDRNGVSMSIIRGRNIEVDPQGGGNQEWVTVEDVDVPNNRIYARFGKNHAANTPISVEINAVLAGDPYPWKGSQLYPDRAYSVIMDQDRPIAAYAFDEIAKVPWLGYSDGGHEDHFFVSYDDQRSIAEKWNYFDQRSLGGQIVFELGGGYRKSFTGGLKDSLLQAVKIPLITRFAEQNKSATKSATAFNGARHLVKSGSYLHEVFTSGREIFYRRSTDGGSTWDETELISPDLKYNSAPSIAATGAYVQIVWQRQTGTKTFDVLHRRSTNSGGTWEGVSQPWPVSVTVSGSQTEGTMPVVEYATIGSVDHLVVVYCSRDGLEYRLSTNNGAAWDNSVIITDNQDVRFPSLTGGDGYFSLVYDYAGDTEGPYSQTFDGSNWEGAKSVADGTGTNDGAFSSVTIDADNGPIAAWSSVGTWETRNIVFRAGYADNTWSDWFAEFGNSQLFDWSFRHSLITTVTAVSMVLLLSTILRSTMSISFS